MNLYQENSALAGVVQWTDEHQQENQKVTGLIPGQGTCLSLLASSLAGGMQGAAYQCFSFVHQYLSFSLPSPLSKNK